MEEYKFIDENQQYTFDFSNAVWAISNLNYIYNSNINSTLADVDFIVETQNDILFIEYKNSDIVGASNPDAFIEKIKKDKHYISIAQKYYGSLFYILACKKLKKFKYVYILECNKADSVLRGIIRNKIKKYLPFKLNQCDGIKQELIANFEILSINDWNLHNEYGKFPIKPIT